jgi:hypothetical protein
MMAHNPDFELRPHTVTATGATAQSVATDQSEREAELDVVARMYKSLPVNDNYIRLLQVRTRDGASGNDAFLDCQLYVTDLNLRPPYTALSYVWGRSISRRRIICNGVALSVTENCYSALQHLHAANGTFDTWVDAICINQKDQDEKMHQINLMGDIYSQAGITYVWLGLGDAATHRVAAFLGRAGFLEHFFRSSGAWKHILRKFCAWAAILQYIKGFLGLESSTVPYHGDYSCEAPSPIFRQQCL